MDTEQLLKAIDFAIDLYQACQPIKGMLPNTSIIQDLLDRCGVQVEYKRCSDARELVIEQRSQGDEPIQEPDWVQAAKRQADGLTRLQSMHYGECVECGRAAVLTETGYCEGCVLSDPRPRV